VMVTASLPPFAQQGTKLDVVVSSAGDARSLVGGTLILTPLVGVDGQTYAMAQGPIHVGGYGSRGRSGSRLTKNHLNVGRIPEGALVERSVIASLEREGVLTLVLNKPDFSTMKAVVDAVNASLGGTLPAAVARHAGAVDIVIPEAARTRVPEFIAALEVLDVVPDTVARVVLNPRTGTIVVGSDVRISPIAIAHGGLKLEISETPDASQPQALAQGQTVVTSTSELRADEARGGMRVVQPGTTLSDLADALNALGVPPRDLVSILESIAAAGALHAQLEVL